MGFVRIEENPGHFHAAWEITLDTEKNSLAEVKERIAGVNKKSRKFDFFFHLHLRIMLCFQNNALSKTLQSVRMSLVEEKQLGNVVIESLKKYRDKERCKLF